MTPTDDRNHLIRALAWLTLAVILGIVALLAGG